MNPDVKIGDKIVLTATNDKRNIVGSRGVVERVVVGVDRHVGGYVCIHVRWDDGTMAGLVDTLGDRWVVGA